MSDFKVEPPYPEYWMKPYYYSIIYHIHHLCLLFSHINVTIGLGRWVIQHGSIGTCTIVGVLNFNRVVLRFDTF